jgi:hypothetical protein
LLWFEVSLVSGTLLLTRAHGATRITATAIYAASVCGMFGISALYHRGNWSATWRQRLQRLDHAMIFFLIAGTATPAFLLAVQERPAPAASRTPRTSAPGPRQPIDRLAGHPPGIGDLAYAESGYQCPGTYLSLHC